MSERRKRHRGAVWVNRHTKSAYSGPTITVKETSLLKTDRPNNLTLLV
jgi:hypothetical protein